MKFCKIVTCFWLITTFVFFFSTVFIVNGALFNGVVTGKYFWFYTSIGVANVVTFVFVLIHKLYFKLKLFDFFILILIGSVLFSSIVINTVSQNTTKITLFALLAILYFNFRLLSNLQKTSPKTNTLFFIMITGLVEVIWGLRQLYGFIPSQHSLFRLTGSFFNPGPYAGYLAVVFPLALSYLMQDRLPQRAQRIHKDHKPSRMSISTFVSFVKNLCEPFGQTIRWLIALLTFVCILMVLPATMSRAAWLAAIGGCGVVLFFYSAHRYRAHSGAQRKMLTLIIAVVLVAGCMGMYFLKKDSADGRVLMWKIALQAAIKHPLGVGLGNFAGAYGEAQAAYFVAGKGTATEEFVAGSPVYGFNEYLQIAVESGVIALVLFLIIVFVALRSLIKSKELGMAGSMVSLLVFAFFSYPFSVLPLLIVFVFLLAMSGFDSTQMTQISQLGADRKFKSAIIHKICVICVLFSCISVTAYCLYREYPKYMVYKKWNSIQYLYRYGNPKEAVNAYCELYPLLNDQIKFLFEYAQSLSQTEQYEESNQVLEKAIRISCDPMLYNVMGNNYKGMGEYGKAENMYVHASHIVPNRHYPLYLLMKLYQETGQTDKAKAMANVLLEKPIKVPSTAIREMQEEARKTIEN